MSATACSAAAVSMQDTQSAMSPQLAIAFVHEPFSKFGHMPMSQPIVDSGWSSPSPHWALCPPQFVAIRTCNFVLSFARRALVRASGHGPGFEPFSTASLHLRSAW
ncbi:MAG: hypothetical protein E6J72_00215 [Deltaproteobacteria bacterium]|nr:MAG: hypothetical protein E6J72_00215 [Deltaproteobacteria bacterium]